ncbi:response regulator [Halobacterium bonnevillei]|uniref:Response regulator n=1 Tax=Halobacterium bonnevillei TaxID=2692200 RepID=A0A6B0SUI0_9EURY|nr:response regulator [Halobacterium bonnevillei]MXR21219.1 response regulator [Halobacterium bonnevillei]
MADVNSQPDARRDVSGTVLVVDDEPELAGMYAAMLEDRHTVRTATSGEAALRQFTSDVDVVLLDRRMPDVTGDELLDVVRTEGYDYQVAMVTAVEPDGDVTELAFDAYVVKPVRRRDLRDVVAELLLRSEYGAGIQELLRVASKLAALETRNDPADLADDEDYQRLLRRLARLQRASRARQDELLDRVEATTLFRDALQESREGWQ